MLHIHDSRLQLHELHRADLLGEAAQVRVAAHANGEEPMRASLITLPVWLTGAIPARIRLQVLAIASAARLAAWPASFRLRGDS